MYPEFVAIYVLLAIVILLLGGVLFLLIKLFKNGNSFANNAPSSNAETYYQQPYQQYQNNIDQFSQAGSVVFCKNCATQYDASQLYCPQCGARR